MCLKLPEIISVSQLHLLRKYQTGAVFMYWQYLFSQFQIVCICHATKDEMLCVKSNQDHEQLVVTVYFTGKNLTVIAWVFSNILKIPLDLIIECYYRNIRCSPKCSSSPLYSHKNQPTQISLCLLCCLFQLCIRNAVSGCEHMKTISYLLCCKRIYFTFFCVHSQTSTGLPFMKDLISSS